MGELIVNLDLEALSWVKNAGSMMPAQLAMMEQVSLEDAEASLERIRDKGLIILSECNKYRLA